MKIASASETPIAGVARPSQQAQPAAVLARAAVAAAVSAPESRRPAAERLAATGPAVLDASRPAERAVAAVSAAVGPAVLGASRSAERAVAAISAAMGPGVWGPPRCAEPAAVAAVRVPASRGASTVLSEERRVAPAPVRAPPEQVAAPAGLWPRAVAAVAPQRPVAALAPQRRAAALAGPVSRWVVVPATRAWSARGAQDSAQTAASWIRPQR